MAPERNRYPGAATPHAPASSAPGVRSATACPCAPACSGRVTYMGSHRMRPFLAGFFHVAQVRGSLTMQCVGISWLSIATRCTVFPCMCTSPFVDPFISSWILVSTFSCYG